MNQLNRKVLSISHQGWSDWHALVGNSKYYNYDVSDNGVKVHHGGSSHPQDVEDIGSSVGLDAIA